MKKIFNITKTNSHKIITILGIKLKIKLNNLKINTSREEISYIVAREIYSALEVSKQHTKVFSEYQNYHHNDILSIVGCGPSINHYNNEIKNDVKIALNDAIFFDKFNFDYLFNWDIGVTINTPNYYEIVKQYPCKKFYGHCIVENYENPLDNYSDYEHKIKHFYYSARHGWPAFNFGEIIHRDLTTYPLMDFGSISFGALHFALFTRPKKIYLIGLDTANVGHILGADYECTYDTQRMLNGYNKFKHFIDIYYPDVDVISVNPVGLKGLFKDVYTQSFVDAHPELLKENIEIINEDTENI